MIKQRGEMNWFLCKVTFVHQSQVSTRNNVWVSVYFWRYFWGHCKRNVMSVVSGQFHFIQEIKKPARLTWTLKMFLEYELKVFLRMCWRFCYLCLSQHQRRGHLKAFGPGQVLVEFELVLQLQKLLAGEGGPRPPALPQQSGLRACCRKRSKVTVCMAGPLWMTFTLTLNNSFVVSLRGSTNPLFFSSLSNNVFILLLW